MIPLLNYQHYTHHYPTSSHNTHHRNHALEIRNINTTASTSNIASTAGKSQNRPSSPRQFFERLYGHLEEQNISAETVINLHSSDSTPPNAVISDNLSDINIDASIVNDNICDTTCQSDDCTLSSPDISISEERISNTSSCPLYDTCSQQLQNYNKINVNTTTAAATASSIAGTHLGFQNDPHFPSGLSAFWARRRRKEGRQRRQRTTFSTEQTLRLEVEFHRNEYISRSRRFELAEILQLTDTQIKIWFQNRRAKDKRIEKAQIDQQYRNLVVANGFMTTIMGQTSYPTPVLTNFHPQLYQFHNCNSNTQPPPVLQIRSDIAHNMLTINSTRSRSTPSQGSSQPHSTPATIINNHSNNDVNYNDINSLYRTHAPTNNNSNANTNDSNRFDALIGSC